MPDDFIGKRAVPHQIAEAVQRVELAALHIGRRALELAGAFTPDAAVLDIGMSGPNGCDLARQLRKGASDKTLLLIALSGLGQPDDKAGAIEAGFDHHLTKPADLHMLLGSWRDRARLCAGWRECSGVYVGYLMRSRFRLVVRSLVIHWFLLVLA